MIRILLCDDQTDTRTSLAMLLELEADIEVVGQAEGGAEAVQLAFTLQPDVILMDLKMPGINGIMATQQIRARYLSIKIIALTTYDNDEWVRRAIKAGVDGYILKDSAREDLLRAIRGTVAGKTFIDPGVAGNVLAQLSHLPHAAYPQIVDQLSERDITILQLIVSGLTNTQIAERLHLSDGTVRNYISTLLAKIGVTDRTQAAVFAMQHGIHAI